MDLHHLDPSTLSSVVVFLLFATSVCDSVKIYGDT